MQMTWQKRRAPSCSRMERKTLMRRGKRFAKRRERYETAEAATRDLKSDSIQDLLAVKRLVKILDRNRRVSRFAAHLASPRSVRINRTSTTSSSTTNSDEITTDTVAKRATHTAPHRIIIP